MAADGAESLEALEEKIERALEVLAHSRKAREKAEEENSRLRRQLADTERDKSEVRRRIERLMKQIDSLSGG